MPWTYAEPDPDDPDGPYRRLGGGSYDAAHDTYGQGAFNADDISGAAVVYLRHARQHHDGHSMRQAPGTAARRDLPPDLLRAEHRKRRPVDAARRHPQPQRRTRGGAGAATISVYDASGRLVTRTGEAAGRQVSAVVVGGGFTVVER